MGHSLKLTAASSGSMVSERWFFFIFSLTSGVIDADPDGVALGFEGLGAMNMSILFTISHLENSLHLACAPLWVRIQGSSLWYLFVAAWRERWRGLIKVWTGCGWSAKAIRKGKCTGRRRLGLLDHDLATGSLYLDSFLGLRSIWVRLVYASAEVAHLVVELTLKVIEDDAGMHASTALLYIGSGQLRSAQ